MQRDESAEPIFSARRFFLPDAFSAREFELLPNDSSDNSGGDAPVKLLVIMPLAEQRGGGELMLMQLLREGRQPGVSWHVVFLEDGPMVAEARELGIDVTVVPAGRMRQPHKSLAAVRRIAQIAGQEKADAIIGWMTKGYLYGVPAAKLSGRKIPAILYHLAVPTENEPMDRLSARLMGQSGALTLCAAGRDALLRMAPRADVQIVYPGVDSDRFDPARLPTPEKARADLGLPADGPLIGIVGRLQRWKGMHTVIEAMPAVLEKHPDARLVIVGGEHALEPGYPALLKERTAALGIGKSVIMAGLQKNIPEWVQAMDIFVHASDAEPFGIVIIEAMALGKPVIAGSAGGPTEILTPEKNGLLSPFEDAPALAANINRFLDDPDAARRMGQAAQKRAQEFSTTRYAHGFIAAVREILGKNGDNEGAGDA